MKYVKVFEIITVNDFCSVSLFSEVCVDKARLDEYEQRASEMAQKASFNNLYSSIYLCMLSTKFVQ